VVCVGCVGCGRCGGVGSLLTFDIPQTALVATLDTYDFIKIDFRLCFFPICLFIGNGGILTVKNSQICQYIDDPCFYSINKYTIVLRISNCIK
jgi:hypothetical protein